MVFLGLTLEVVHQLPHACVHRKSGNRSQRGNWQGMNSWELARNDMASLTQKLQEIVNAPSPGTSQEEGEGKGTP